MSKTGTHSKHTLDSKVETQNASTVLQVTEKRERARAFPSFSIQHYWAFSRTSVCLFSLFLSCSVVSPGHGVLLALQCCLVVVLSSSTLISLSHHHHHHPPRHHVRRPAHTAFTGWQVKCPPELPVVTLWCLSADAVTASFWQKIARPPRLVPLRFSIFLLPASHLATTANANFNFNFNFFCGEPSIKCCL